MVWFWNDSSGMTYCKSMRPSDKLEDITFTYYGMRNQKFDVTAVCQTEGGPEQLGSKHVIKHGNWK